MTIGRRAPPPKPPKLAPPAVPPGTDEKLQRLWEWAIQTGGNLDALWDHQRAAYNGLPAPHSSMHAATGADPITGETEDAEFLALMAYMEA